MVKEVLYQLRKGPMILVVCLFTLSLTSCMEDMVKTLQDAIDVLDKMPSKWESVLEDLLKKLDETTGDMAEKARKEIEHLLKDAQEFAASTVFCSVDYLGTRVKLSLEYLAHKAFPGHFPEPDYIPGICTVDPDEVDAGITRSVKYIGFDFLKFKEQGKYSAALIYKLEDDKVINENFGAVAVPTNYVLIVDIQAADFNSIDYSKGPQLVLRWQSKNVDGQSEVPIIKKPEPSPHEWDISVSGLIEIRDDEWGEDERCTYTVNETIKLTVARPNNTYDNDWCCGDEVRGELHLILAMDSTPGNVSIHGVSEYYEGTSCDTEDKEESDKFTIELTPSGQYQYDKKLSDDDGDVTFNLKFKNIAITNE